MKRRLLYGLIGLAVIASAAYFLSSESKIIKSGRQPGDQRVREHRKAPSLSQDVNADQLGSQRRSHRSGGHGSNAMSLVGKEKVPIFLDGRQKGAIDGRDLSDRLEKVTVLLRKGPKTGWVAAQALKLSGIEQAQSVAFSDRTGKTQTISWSQLEGEEPLLVFSYTQGGQLSLYAGSKLDQEDPKNKKSGKQRANRKMRSQVKDYDRTFISDIVKIEVRNG
jgi:hypothetical protein